MGNVTHWEWCEEMREAYAASKLVVVPSRWEEPFGRVPAEAMVSGIPCVVSDRGGLPEVVGDTGETVSDIESVEAWLAAIDRALNIHDPQAQKQRAERFSAAEQIPKLLALIDDCVDS
jgi:glycosyltransferase involved in cell wall biosynthesis